MSAMNRALSLILATSSCVALTGLVDSGAARADGVPERLRGAAQAAAKRIESGVSSLSRGLSGGVARLAEAKDQLRSSIQRQGEWHSWTQNPTVRGEYDKAKLHYGTGKRLVRIAAGTAGTALWAGIAVKSGKQGDVAGLVIYGTLATLAVSKTSDALQRTFDARKAAKLSTVKWAMSRHDPALAPPPNVREWAQDNKSWLRQYDRHAAAEARRGKNGD